MSSGSAIRPSGISGAQLSRYDGSSSRLRCTFVAPGAKALTLIWSGASSTASWIVSALMPPLLAAYAARLRRPLAATTDETLTIEPPPPARINRAASTEQKNVPFRLVSMTRSQISSLGSARFIQPGMPAQLTRTSSRSRLRTFSAIWAGLETSKASARPRPLSGSSARTSAGSSRSLTCTTAPSAASPRASARPIPLPAPVTSAALPSRRPLTRSPLRVQPRRRCARTSRGRRWRRAARARPSPRGAARAPRQPTPPRASARRHRSR